MLELHHISAGYQGVPVLSDVSLTFPTGEITILIGPNGCGKSTLLRTTLGLLPKLGGDILLDGQPLEGLAPQQVAQRVSYLSQTRNIPSITAQRMVLHGRFPYLSYPRRYSEKDHEIVRQSLARLGASDLAHRPMPQLSGGQRQRIYLAMALAQQTQTILMDEPTTFLDVQYQLEVMSVAQQLAAQGHAVVLVLHDLCLALRFGHRIAVLDGGVLQQVGAPEEIFHSKLLEDTFHIRLGRIQTPSGWQYYYH